MGDDFEGSSIAVPTGAEHVPGLDEGLGDRGLGVRVGRRGALHAPLVYGAMPVFRKATISSCE